MIENEGKKYYTTYEILNLVRDETSELNELWNNRFPKYRERQRILFEQVSRVLYKAKNRKQISYITFTRSEQGTKKYFAFLLEDVIAFLREESNFNKAFNIKTIDKE